mmetsp:Transcript_10763/g.32353  ORF Transcript_10763/g.32353 Transcript_10763/m.32353 type:complete len:106 (-) Transcript_10763:1459-1776(-)
MTGNGGRIKVSVINCLRVLHLATIVLLGVPMMVVVPVVLVMMVAAPVVLVMIVAALVRGIHQMSVRAHYVTIHGTVTDLSGIDHRLTVVLLMKRTSPFCISYNAK